MNILIKILDTKQHDGDNNQIRIYQSEIVLIQRIYLYI
jgi:hypothetical protein